MCVSTTETDDLLGKGGDRMKRMQRVGGEYPGEGGEEAERRRKRGEEC